MDNEEREILEPNFEGEKMKMPEGTVTSLGQPESSMSKKFGIMLAVLFLFLILIAGGLFYWYTLKMAEPIVPPSPVRPTAEENNEPESTTAEAQVETLEAMSTSDEIFTIEADLDSTNLNALDTELNAIEAEIEMATN